MLHTSLTSYVSKALATGMAADSIRRNLLSAGWNKGDVDEALLPPRHSLAAHEENVESVSVSSAGSGVSIWRPVSIGLAAVALGILAGEASFSLVQKQVAVGDIPEIAVVARPSASTAPIMLISGVSASPEPANVASDLADAPMASAVPIAKVTTKPLATAAATAYASPSPVVKQLVSSAPSATASPTPSASSSPTPTPKPSPIVVPPTPSPKL